MDESVQPPAGRVVVANAGAGSTETAAVHAAVARLATDAPVELHWTAEPREFVDLVGDLDPCRQVVVAGGDGSIHLALETVAALARTDQPVGIIPLGTGNDFARNHGIPLDAIDAADVVVAGHAASVAALRVQAGRDDPTMVANNIHLGLGVRAARSAAALKPRFGRIAYPLATAYQGLSRSTVEVAVDVDGERVHDGPLLALLVLLGSSMGGGVELVDAEPDRIDVVAVRPVAPGRRLGLLRTALRGELDTATDAQRYRGSSVVIDRDGGLDANLDGELVHLDSPTELTLCPRAWKVLVPR